MSPHLVFGLFSDINFSLMHLKCYYYRRILKGTKPLVFKYEDYSFFNSLHLLEVKSLDLWSKPVRVTEDVFHISIVSFLQRITHTRKRKHKGWTKPGSSLCQTTSCPRGPTCVFFLTRLDAAFCKGTACLYVKGKSRHENRKSSMSLHFSVFLWILLSA